MNIQQFGEKLDAFGEVLEAHLARPSSYLGQIATGSALVYAGERTEFIPITATGVGLMVGGSVIMFGEAGIKLMESSRKRTDGV